MLDSTRDAIAALVAVDKTMTDDERERVMAAMRGDGCAVVTFADACKRIGVSRPTVYRLVKCGRLVAIKGASGNAIGVSGDSLNKYLKGA